MDIPKEELFAPGHRGCAGCGAAIGARLALKASGKNTVAICATGCLEVMTTPYPETAWRVPFVHVAFENAGAVASGVERALKSQGKEDTHVIAFGGDGGSVDIGLQSISGAMERGHNITYICYDNEAYMNTGIQRSGATPWGASTTTSPAGSESFGEDKPKKNMPMIMAAHGIPYIATASIAYPEDYMKKVKKAVETKGPAYIHLNQPCTTGWGFDPSKTIELGRLGVETGFWPLYEIENGEFKVTYRPTERKPVVEYLKAQKRFRHLDEEHVQMIQDYVNNQCEELGI
ncbi:MAG: pyruvate synthase subunit PorB [Methanobrevibacter boviskoreani]|uniref:pyruvate synthase subunit PorB n=1 Tax=Methanobrevibacter boviskoreani TaxID=1348249 RepID=UPI0005942C7A|nr:pyruvate synthase subunit PorB [Methanobrevibacter boviskoreani]MCI6774788.1 pyruvate synthase subunit PorB [Methanobrevibacter boviskoreani]MDD6256100.1 pyruvate synthase subunit PorB [Methanobrevibacter boviskoreani]MDY5615081.1 pyruvate synthase subunit PorB [Methanobrevibacter boviskoreani]